MLVKLLEYREHFELYANLLRGIDVEYLKGIFLNGLKEEVKVELKLHLMQSLSEMMDYTQRIYKKNRALNKGGGSMNEVLQPFLRRFVLVFLMTSYSRNE